MESGREGCGEVALIRLGLAEVWLDHYPEQREQALERALSRREVLKA